jgi:osmotically inducible protein OsmC
MALINRSATAVWHGPLDKGNGTLTTGSKVLQDQPYSFKMRFENAPGTNPEELIGAAHAGCFNMEFSFLLTDAGHAPEKLETTATVFFGPKEGGGFKIPKIKLEVVGVVSGMSEDKFKELAEKAGAGCPVSGLLRPGLEEFELVARLA